VFSKPAKSFQDSAAENSFGVMIGAWMKKTAMESSHSFWIFQLVYRSVYMRVSVSALLTIRCLKHLSKLKLV
jgi:hypothetical protein